MSTTAPAKTIRVALVGNPNTGKSTLFTALAGVRQRVGNYPGRHGREENRPPAARRPRVRTDRSAGHVQPGAALARRNGGGRRAARPPRRRRPARRRALDRRRQQPGAESVSGQPGAGARPADGRRAEHGRPGRDRADRDRRRRARQATRRAGRRRAGQSPHRPRRTEDGAGRSRATGSRSRAKTRSRPRFNSRPANSATLAQRRRDRSRCPRSSSSGCCWTATATWNTRCSTATPPTAPQKLAHARESLAAAGLPVPAVEAMARYDWVARTLDGVAAPARRPSAARPATASTPC